MVAMGMADDDVFDVGGVEAELAQAAFDILLGFAALSSASMMMRPAEVLIAQALVQ